MPLVLIIERGNMPNPFIKKVAEQTGHKKHTIEKEFKKEEEIAKHKGARNPYAYATAVVERMNPGYKPKTSQNGKKPSGE